MTLAAQNKPHLNIAENYENLNVEREGNTYEIRLSKGKHYEFLVLQQGIDVEVILEDSSGKELIKMDSPNGAHGYEKFEFQSVANANYTLKIKPFDLKVESENNIISILIRQLSKKDLKRRELIRKELEIENKKNVQTLDIDHFWQAFDLLKTCKSKSDSIRIIQNSYLDRATSGFKEFMRVRSRQLNAENFVRTISKYPKFYNSIRENSYKVKEAEPLIEAVFKNFSQLYPNFKPFKVCFAIGTIGTGGTTSDNFVLIGTEISTATAYNDLSEFEGSSKKSSLAYKGDFVQKLKNIVAHECVHTQQKRGLAKTAVACHLLQSCLREGAADFIGELVAGGQINASALDYGDAHEKMLWASFKSELCNTSHSGWLYNYSEVKDKPADLGYYMGYKIAQAYYNNAENKQQAIIDIIEMDNPFQYLEQSGYDQKFQKN
ncbi:hypothetical protein A9Q87_09165 [Flavobacteriales bacterium 34_180_T64]|nr:hypothetical protein A9Q87_09165 [Flavobacteriales bacterium 34_180_T64]